ncbi:S-layer homology domain-containing protein [Paenibacillus kandeliae]|uniref:S-layer homology domain-containing protein n=1 Tax=Paenibacillus kandeliae TaxID=3231269 RepID=UPI0034597C11
MKLVNRQKLIATAIIFGITAAPFTSPLWSPSTAFAAETGSSSIAEVRTLGLMTGGAKGDFMPDKVLTRAEMAKILCNIFELDVNPTSKTSYLDVSSANWSAPYIEAVQAAGYMEGTGELFHPSQPITRQELVTSLVKAMDLQSENSDGSSPSAMDIARSYGMVIADSNTDVNAPLDRKTGADLFVQLLDHPVGQVNAQGNTVRVGNIPYTINGSLQGLFGVDNGAVLKGAKLDIDRSQRTVTHINTIVLNANGGVFDGKGISFDGNLVVNGSVTLKNIQSTGNLQINGTGATPLTAQLDNSSWGNVTVSSLNSIIQASGSSTIGKLTLNNTATVQTQGNASIQQLAIQPNLKQLTLDGNVNVLDASQYDGSPLVTLQPAAVIGNITLSKDKSANDVIRNYMDQKSAVSNINGSKNTDSPAPAATNINTKKKDKDKDKEKDIPTITLDISKLITGIEKANTMLMRPNDIPVLDEQPGPWKDMLKQAIEQATSTLNQADHTQQDIDTAVISLKASLEQYKASQKSLYNYYDFLMTVKRIPINYTDVGRFMLKDRMNNFEEDYFNPLTTKAQFDEYVSIVDEMRKQFEQIQDVNFNELNLRLENIYDLSHGIIDREDSQKLMSIYYRYTDMMHSVMTQDQVDRLLEQLNEELSSSGLGHQENSEENYHNKLRMLTGQVETLLYDANDNLQLYMPNEFPVIKQALQQGNSVLSGENTELSNEEAFNQLNMAWTMFHLAYNQKDSELRNRIQEQLLSIDHMVRDDNSNLSEENRQQLLSLQERAQRWVNDPYTGVSLLGSAQSMLDQALSNLKAKDASRLLALIEQAQIEYDSYARYHLNSYVLGSYEPSSYKYNQNFFHVFNNARELVNSTQATQNDLDQYELKLKAALADYSKDWISSDMIQNALNTAYMDMDAAHDSSDYYYIRLQDATNHLQSAVSQSDSNMIPFVELRDMYIAVLEADRAFVKHQSEANNMPESSTPEDSTGTTDPSSDPTAPSSETGDTSTSDPNSNPTSGTETESGSETPKTQNPDTDPSPNPSEEPASQPADSNQPSNVFEPDQQHYDYSTPAQNTEEADTSTPTITPNPEPTDTP